MEGFLRVAAPERVLAGGAVDRGRLEQLPAVEDRLGVDLRRAAAGGPDREGDVRGQLASVLSMRPRIVPAIDLRARLQRA